MLSCSNIGLCLLSCCFFACCKSCSQALLNDTLRQGAAAKSPLTCRELALSQPCLGKKPLSRSGNTLLLTFQILPPVSPFPQGFAAGPFLLWMTHTHTHTPHPRPQARRHRDGAEPWEGAGAGSGFRMG